MEYLILYGLFVITTLIVVMIYIMQPIINELFTTNPRPAITTLIGSKFLLYILLSIFTIVFAPIMFLVWMLPKQHEAFKTVLLAELKKS